jgi:glutathione S-transferase
MGASDLHLWSLTLSPWSLRAKWALAESQVPYKNHDFSRPFAERKLRFKLRNWEGPLTVPVLIAKHVAFVDGVDIAKFADAHRPKTQKTIFPLGVDEWLPLIEEVCAHERCGLSSHVQDQCDVVKVASNWVTRYA